MRASLDPIGGFARDRQQRRCRGASCRKCSRPPCAISREQGFRGPFAVADGRIIHNAGGSEAQELAFAIAAAVDYLRALEASGVPLDAARGMIYFRLAADADEFLTIAKFRALRKLWARVEAACGLAPKPAYVAAETAWRMMTQRDPYVNMLRTTIAVTAAGLGGADSIAALPHTAALGLPDAFARRVARNTQLILLEEFEPGEGRRSGRRLRRHRGPDRQALRRRLGAVPGDRERGRRLGGARTRAGAEECRGGARRAPEGGRAPQGCADRHQRLSQSARRRRPRCSTSRRSSTPKESAATVTTEPLPSIRLAEPFEALRDASDRMLAKTGARPKVFLANLGKLSEFTARAMFAKNFYEAGGIEALSNDGFKDQAAMIAAFKASGAKLACLCSSDKVYETQAADAAKALTAAGATVHLAGRPGENEANWRQAGVKSFVFMGCDVVSTLQAAHDILGVK